MKICSIWSDVLGVPVEKVGVHDNFFALGGNSILAIKVVNQINRYYQSYLKVADIFMQPSIELLVNQLFQTKRGYQVTIKLNNTYAKPNMFMIHSGIGGCEVYTQLAASLSEYFCCYGIDSYNWYHEDKISNLTALAHYYLSHIHQIMKENDQETYHLLGWSFGGIVALEIASLLEQQGITKIKVYLLDTVLHDDVIALSNSKINLDEYKIRARDYLIQHQYDELYIQKFISNLDIGRILGEQSVLVPLQYTYAILFKAMLQDKQFNVHNDDQLDLYNHITKLDFNNIDKIFSRKSNLSVIHIDDASHGNIVHYHDLVRLIVQYNPEDKEGD